MIFTKFFLLRSASFNSQFAKDEHGRKREKERGRKEGRPGVWVSGRETVWLVAVSHLE